MTNKRRTTEAWPLGRMMRLLRNVDNRTLAEVADEIGISEATVLRIEQGHSIGADSWLRVTCWLAGARLE